METPRERQGVQALRAYVAGDSSEPIVLSAFHGMPREEVTSLVSRHRQELEEIDGGRLVILESMLLPWEARTR